MKKVKRGESNIIATVLLVGFVIAILLIAFLWVKSYTEQRASKSLKLGEKQYECTQFIFTAVASEKASSSVFVTLENTGQVPMEKFSFVIAGETPVENYEVLNPGDVKKYEANFVNVVSASEVRVIPWAHAAQKKFVPCSDQSIIVNIP